MNKFRATKIALLAVCCAGILHLIFFSKQPSLVCSLEAREVLINQQFQVTLTAFVPPSAIATLHGPDLSSFTIVKTERSQNFGTIRRNGLAKVNFFYTVEPKEKGDFTIGSATVTVGGKTLRTKPMPLRVSLVRVPDSYRIG